jgi:hypothetical protein
MRTAHAFSLAAVAVASLAAPARSQSTTPAFDVRSVTAVIRTTNPTTTPASLNHRSLLNDATQKTTNGAAAVAPDNSGHADFHCTGTNDSVVIQSAVDYVARASAGRGGRIVLMEGTYFINAPIVLKYIPGQTPVAEHTGIIIEGHSAVGVTNGAGFGLPPDLQGTVLLGTTTIFDVQSASHIEFRSLAFKITGSGSNPDGRTAIQMQDCTDVLVEKCNLFQCPRAIVNGGGWDVTCNLCRFQDCGNATHAAVTAEVTGTRETEKPWCAGWMFHQCSWVEKQGIAFESKWSGVHGTWAKCAGDVSFVQCKFEGWGTKGKPSIQGALNGSRVIGCTFFFTDPGSLSLAADSYNPAVTCGPHIALLNASRGNIISSNKFYIYSMHAVVLQGYHNIVTSNHFHYTLTGEGTTAYPPSHVLVRQVYTNPAAESNLVTGNIGFTETGSTLMDFATPAAAASQILVANNNLGN